MSDLINIDVLGSCVSRDIVDRLLQKTDNIVVRENQQCQAESVSRMVEIDEQYKIENTDLVGRRKGFYRIKQELNETVKNKLMSSGAEWLIIDFHHASLKSFEVKSGDETHYYQIDWGGMNEREIRIAYEKREKDIDSIRKVRYPRIPDLNCLIDEFIQFVTYRYGNKIVVIDLFKTHWILNKNGEVTYWRNPIAEEATGYERLYMQRFIERTNAYYVICPTNIITDEYHRSLSHLHYVSEYYEYASECVYNIITGDPEYLIKNNMLFMQLTLKLDNIRIGDVLSKNNTLKRIDSMWKKTKKVENIEEVIQFAEDYASKITDEEFLPDIYLRIGTFYYQRKDGGRDYSKAAEWFKKAVDMGFPSARSPYFDALWKINTPESLLKMICFGYEYSKKGDPEIMGRLGRAYRKGKGIKKNLVESSVWLKKSSDLGVQWAKCELFDVLWEINTEDSLKQMVILGEIESKNSNYELMARLARAYREGKGIHKDLSKAQSLMRVAADNGIEWAAIEYFDMIWTLNDSILDKEGIGVVLPLAKNGNGEAMARVGRCYYYGRGVPVDNVKAEEWMRKALEKKVYWASEELKKIVKNEQSMTIKEKSKTETLLKKIFRAI